MIVHDLDVGDQYAPSTGWLGFLITFQYPNADVYPHFLDPDVHRVDGAALGEGFQPSNNFWERAATQVSRRSNRWNPAVDTAAIKLARVLEWIRSQ